MHYSPKSPRRRRKSSLLDQSSTPSTPQSPTFTPSRSSHSRKSSLQSVQSALTSRPVSSYNQSGEHGLANGFTQGDSGGLASLADELAEGWDEEGDTGEAIAGDQFAGDGAMHEYFDKATSTPQSPNNQNEASTIGLAVTTPDGTADYSHTSSPTVQTRRSKTRRRSKTYDGPEDGENFDSEGVYSSLEACIDSVGDLGQQGAEVDGTNRDGQVGAIQRVVDALKELGSQAGIESHATRLANAHSSLNTNLIQQMRQIATLTNSLISPLASAPSSQTIEPILPLLASLTDSLPQPSTTTLPSLHALHTSTTDLLSTLSYLSDTLHMTRQTTTLAGRRLRSVREIVGTIVREMEEAEEARRWLQLRDWDKRLARREAAMVCGEVLEGFEQVCKGWRDKMVEETRTGLEIEAG